MVTRSMLALPAKLAALTALGVAVVAALPDNAHAYPQYAAKGYTGCGACHYNPSGGGLLNSYGHASLSATFPDDVDVEAIQELRTWLMKNDVLGYDAEGEPALQWDVGIDTRLLLMNTTVDCPDLENPGQSSCHLGEPYSRSRGAIFIPMLVELGGVVGYGPILVYATGTLKRPRTAPPERMFFSREHWIQYKVDDTLSAKLGRVVLPFGLRIPDHTQYTREELGFDKYGQTYAAQVDWFGEDLAISGAVFAGDPYTAVERQERGAVATVSLNWDGRGSAGVSVLGAGSELVARFATALFARLRVWDKTYVLAEVDLDSRWGTQIGRDQQLVATMLRAGWFVLESTDIYYELGTRIVPEHGELTKIRHGIGVNWKALPWLEVAPALLLEDQVDAGLQAYGMLQLHVIY